MGMSWPAPSGVIENIYSILSFDQYYQLVFSCLI